MSTLLVGVVAAVGLAIICTVLLLIIPIEGKYSGQVLDALSDNAFFVLKQGDAFISGPDGELVPYGHYSMHQGAWRLLATGSSNHWKIVRHLTGFDLISSTNSADRYRFTRSCLDIRIERLIEQVDQMMSEKDQ